MNKKKLFQIAVILIAGIAIALSGTVIVTKVAKRIESTTDSVSVTETDPVTETPTTSPSVPRETVPMGGNNVITTVKGEKPQWKIEEESSIAASIAQSKIDASKKQEQKKTTKPYNGIVPNGKANVISSFVKGVNNLKKTQNFTLQEDSGINITIDDMTGGFLVQQTFETLITQKENKPPKSYFFEKGIDSDTGLAPKEVIPPLGKNLKLDASLVLAATANPTADGGYTATIKLKDEFETFASPAKNHQNITPTINMEEMFSSGAAITDYELLYSGTTITALFDKNNRITYLEYYVAFPTATGSGSLALAPFTVQLHGEYIVKYDITY